MSTISIPLQLQTYLKKNGFYKGALDGKLGSSTYDAIALAIRAQGVNTKGWNKKRLYTGGQQVLFRANKIETGIVDGKEGHVTEYAREKFLALITINYVDETEKLVDAGAIKPVPVKVSSSAISSSHWPLQKNCTSFYGKPGSNQVDAIMPYPLRVAWDLKSTVKKFSVHRLVKVNIERVFQRTLDYYGYERIKELHLDLWGGCLNVRKMRGGKNYSMHSWGIAVDMDPDRNGFKTSWKNAEFSKPAYKQWVQFWYDEGAINLGLERNFDPMHFQFARLR